MTTDPQTPLHPVEVAARAFHKQFGVSPGRVVCAPGRANIIGEHTDYNDGLVLPFAIPAVTAIAFRANAGSRVRVFAETFDELHELELPLATRPATGGWIDYIEGVLREYAAERSLDNGFDAAIASNVPLRSGLSSSASLEIAVALGLQGMFGWPIDDIDLARHCQQAEIHHVGTQCGIMDQAASLLSRADHALCLDTRSLLVRHVHVVLPEMTWLVIQSGVARELTTSDYNQRRIECEQAAAWLGKHTSRMIDALRDVAIDDLEAVEGTMPSVLHRRARHVVTENVRVLKMVDALESGDVNRVGMLLSAAHASYRDDFEASVPEVDTLVTLGLKHGAIGARLTGGGFGGATLHLVPTAKVARFASQVVTDYRRAHGREAEVLPVVPSAGARERLDRQDRF